ncbi:MAG: hypothetical protein U0Y96_00595 [Candidatus Kapaibacterium sp.]
MTKQEHIIEKFKNELSPGKLGNISFRRIWIFVIPATIIIMWYSYSQYYGLRMLSFSSEEHHSGQPNRYYHK